jgi:hypothetical protein
MHKAIEKRAEQMRSKGLEPGAFYGDYFLQTPGMIEAPTEFGVFKVYLDLYPDSVDEAWFVPDAEHVNRFPLDPA